MTQQLRRASQALSLILSMCACTPPAAELLEADASSVPDAGLDSDASARSDAASHLDAAPYTDATTPDSALPIDADAAAFDGAVPLDEGIPASDAEVSMDAAVISDASLFDGADALPDAAARPDAGPTVTDAGMPVLDSGPIDCDPWFSGVGPDQEEICDNAVDDDCNGLVDDGVACEGLVCGGYYAACDSDDDCCSQYTCVPTREFTIDLVDDVWPAGSKNRCMLGPITPHDLGGAGARCHYSKECQDGLECVSGTCATAPPAMCGGGGLVEGDPSSTECEDPCCDDQACITHSQTLEGPGRSYRWACKPIYSCQDGTYRHIPSEWTSYCCPGFVAGFDRCYEE